MPSNPDLGIIAEGTVEMDPMTGRFGVRVIGDGGEGIFIDLQAHLEKYRGEDVRLIVTPLRTVSELTRMVEEGEMALEDVPRLQTRPS